MHALQTIPLINSKRLQSFIQQLGKIGCDNCEGMQRIAFSAEDLRGRNWLISQIEHLALPYSIDAAANIWATYSPNQSTLPPIVIGSHLDTVPNGGKYDGALGVLIALEIVSTLQENKIVLQHPLQIVNFTAEEPNHYNLSTFGSRVVTKKLTAADVEHVVGANGKRLIDGLSLIGGNIETLHTASKENGALTAFIEVHIEQGKRLINANRPVGIVSAITGIYRQQITFYGEANHAGTTLMDDRVDALVAAATFVTKFNALVTAHPDDEIVGTIGRFSISPGAPSIIPNEATLLLEIRGDSQQKIQHVVKEVQRLLDHIQKDRHVSIKQQTILDQAPSIMDAQIINAFQQICQNDIPYLTLGSMAGHDATHLASITKTGMLFVPSIDGKSHCPEELSRIEDIEIVSNVLLKAILNLDKKL